MFIPLMKDLGIVKFFAEINMNGFDMSKVGQVL